MLRPFALCTLVLTPAVLEGQSLARRIAEVPDGSVRFSYASRPDVCGDGRDVIRNGANFVVLPETYGRGHSDIDVCFRGPVRVVLGRRDGETVSYRVHVGGRWSSGDDATDLGVVSAPDAARYMLDAARRAGGRNARYALAAAVFADSVDLTADLARLARDAGVNRGTRENAVFWIAGYDDEPATRALHDLAADDGLEDEVRGAAIIALGSVDISDDEVEWLRRLYPKVSEKLRSNIFLAVSQSDGQRASRWLADVATDQSQTEHTREQALFWLGQGRAPTADLVRVYDRLPETAMRRQYTFVLSQRHDAEALDKLIDVAEHDRDRDVRRQALFWLGQSKDPRAIAYIRDLVTR